MAELRIVNQSTDIRRERRALSDEDFSRFISATQKRSAYRGLSGADRSMLYQLAATTGLRASELASLTTNSLNLTEKPTVTVEAAYSKRRRRDTLPLRRDIAAALQEWIVGKEGELWPGSWHERAAEMVRGDLVRAGIPYQNEHGAYFDFHALRHQFLTNLQRAGVHPKVAQTLPDIPRSR